MINTNVTVTEIEKMNLTAFIKKAMELRENAEFESYVDLLVDEIDNGTDLNDSLCVDALYPEPNGRLVKFGAWSNQSGMFWPEA